MAALALSSGAARAAEEPGPLRLLCGIARPIDDLLHCAPASMGTGDTPSQQSGDGDSGAAATFSLQDQQPVATSTSPRYVDDLLLVRFRASASTRQQQDALRDAGVKAVRRIEQLNVTVVQMPPEHRDDAMTRLRRSDAVAGTERDAVVERLATTPNDTDWSLQWGLRKVDYPAAWDRTRGLASVVVAVLDTGVQAGIPDLQNSVIGGYNAVTPQAEATDDNGHGTSVAGIIAARTNNREGIAGICWTCSVMPIKVLGASGTGDTALLSLGIVHAVDAGARVITMSLGGPVDQQTLDQAVAYAVGRGAILVAAAGNNGTSSPFYPAAIPGVIAVAGTDQSDRLYPWSNFGTWVDVAAPGCNPAPASTGGYVQFCGTSSAAPVVAGLVALQLSQQPNASRDAVVNAINSTAVPIGDSVVYGRIDAASALAALVTQTDEQPPTGPIASPTAKPPETLRGRLSAAAPVRVYRRSIDRTLVTAVLRFTGQPRLSLSIRDETGAVVARVAGRSPLRVTRVLSRGRYAFTIKGAARARATFELALSTHAAAAG